MSAVVVAAIAVVEIQEWILARCRFCIAVVVAAAAVAELAVSGEVALC